MKTPAPNERFAKMAGVFPLKSWCELATMCPADSSVRSATSASRHHVVCYVERTVRTWFESGREKWNTEMTYT